MVSNGNRTAYTQHYSNSQGTVSSVRTSEGGMAARANTGYGQSTVARTAGGDVYAGRDGNVYRNTGSGWQSSDNGNWNSVSPPATAQPRASERPNAQSSSFQGVQQESYNRQRGAAQSQRFQGGGFGGGGFRGGFRR